MKALKAANGFMIPCTGRWPVRAYDALGSRDKGKPRIFWVGRGWYSYKRTGPTAWTEVEVPDAPKEPDSRWCDAGVHEKWEEEWKAYADEYGLPLAATGTMCCDYSNERYTLAQYTQRDRYPSEDLFNAFRMQFDMDMDLYSFDTPVVFAINAPFTIDLIKLLKHLMRDKGVDFDKWNEEVEQSANQWLSENYSPGAADLVEKLIHWKPDPEAEARYREAARTLYDKQEEAMNTCKKLK